LILTVATAFVLAVGTQAQQVTATETVETKVTRQITVTNRTTEQQPVEVAQPQSPAWSFIVGIDQVLNNHDFATLANYIPSRVNYFGHPNASRDWIARDMASDLRTYAWTKTIPNPATYSYWIDVQGLIHESIQEETFAQEARGRYHHAHCLFQTIRQGPLILSLELTVLPGRLAAQ
jgi:hypothetical protein